MNRPPVKKPVDPNKEHPFEWLSSFVGFFIYLLVLKGYFLPLFVIPTGSMAETLFGEHTLHGCPNCGTEYSAGYAHDRIWHLECPNCHWRTRVGRIEAPEGMKFDDAIERLPPSIAGDRIVVHGWPLDPPFVGMSFFGPKRWDVVVFRVPSDGETNYIKRLIGLPGETIEIVDGDIFVDGAIAKKTAEAQESLWLPFYHHDRAPRKASCGGAYLPRWVELKPGAWRDVTSRVWRFAGENAGRAELMFAQDPRASPPPGHVWDVYGYDGPRTPVGPTFPFGEYDRNLVSDVRLTAEIRFESSNGYIEFATTKHSDRFYARLYGDGRVTLEHSEESKEGSGPRTLWSSNEDQRVSLPADGVVFGLEVVDYQVRVTIDGRMVAESNQAEYSADARRAQQLAQIRRPNNVRIAADQAVLSVRHVRLDRDVFYTNDGPDNGQAVGTQGHAVTLSASQCFMLGDNSPASLDSRFSFAQQNRDPIGPHLRGAYERGEYQRGTVPVDQLMGRAFLVYWPGFMPLQPVNRSVLVDLGRVRWIH